MHTLKQIALSLSAMLLGTSTLIAEGRMNILFIAVDDLKPMLGCYGDKHAKTPEIDRLASRGTVFTRAYCQWPVCGPSRASLMTSLRPEAVGVTDLKTDMRAKNPKITALPEYFRSQGYTTAGVGKIYDPRCVDSKRDCDKPSWSIPFVVPKSGDSEAASDDGDGKPAFAATADEDENHTDGQITRSGIELMKRLAKEGKPFFLAVGYKKPHLPFIAPKKYWDLYDRSKVPLFQSSRNVLNDSGYVLHDSQEYRSYGGIPKEGDIPESVQRESIHGYLACVSFIDAQIGKLLRQLDELQLSRNTIVVLWGDHGFHLGDHGMWGKHSTLEQATRVPLLITAPQGVKTQQSPALVEFSDIFPTLCELSGLEVPGGLAGKSPVSVLNGSATSVRVGAVTVFKNRGAYAYSFRTDRYRYTEWINAKNKVVARDLFDYQSDPGETKNLIDDPQYQQQCAELADQLRKAGVGCDRLLASAKSD